MRCDDNKIPDYRRAFLPGGCWFFTVNLLERRNTLLVDHVDVLRHAVAATRRNHPFQIDAWVVLPDHLHAVLTLPPDDADFSVRWRLIKTRFAKSLPKRERLSSVRAARGERGIWQRRLWEHLIRDDGDYQRHVEYCYINPVKHGLVGRVQDWPHSSFHRDVQRGLLRPDWAGDTDASSAMRRGAAEGVTRRTHWKEVADYASLIRPTGYPAATPASSPAFSISMRSQSGHIS